MHLVNSDSINALFGIITESGGMELEDHIRYVIASHRDKAKESSMRFRKHDGETPYGIHPVWCGLTILSELSLPKELRYNGALALLYHDFPEDTFAELPDELPEIVTHWISQMTFYGGSVQEMRDIWNKETEVKLFKLYDKVSNTLDGIWMDAEKRKVHNAYLSKLAELAEETYGNLNIVKIARAVC